MADYTNMVGFGMLAAFGAIAAFIGIAFYVYMALVWMTIAKKLGYDKPWLAWIPIANMFLFPILAKKHWAMGFLLFVPIANIVFFIMWTWDIYEQRKYPGWLSLVPVLAIVPIVNFLAMIGNLVIWGLVAWSDR